MEQEYKPTIKNRIKRFTNECARVLRVTKKPGREEFKTIVKVSGLGIIIVGALGFIVTVIKQVLF